MEDMERTTDLTEAAEQSPFGPGAFEATRPSRRGDRQAEDLHICPSCDSHLVIPVDWAPVSGKRWKVDLRCPECEWAGGGTYSQHVVDRYDEVLDEGTEALLEDLTNLSRANMEEHADAFALALRDDLILPEDF
jgi:hypothetical protein